MVAVYEYMNADWWLGRNTRTGQEGVFPKTYVELIPGGDSADSGYPDEKSKAHGSSSQGGYQSMQGMPQFVHDANSSSHVQPSGHEGTAGKAGEYGKKFGKKVS